MQVSVVKVKSQYPAAPFHPSRRYPEYPYGEQDVAATENVVYEAVRNAFYLLGFDEERYGTREWNPLKHLVEEGSHVVIKPNFVNHWNPLGDSQANFDALVTHVAVIRPLIDFISIAARGRFTVTIADLPIQSADFAEIVRKTGLLTLVRFVAERGDGRAVINTLDLRDYQMLSDESGAVSGTVKQAGDERGYVVVDLGEDSNLTGLEDSKHLFRSLDYKKSETVRRHSNGRHEYVFSKTMLECDCLINVPKMKVHRKSGVTLSLKNMVGTIGDKACLPHYREGAPQAGGDEYPIPSVVNALRGRYSFPLRKMGRIVWRAVRPLGLALLRLNRAVHGNQGMINITGGDWYGNDTIWRMVHDLNAAIFHADADGRLNCSLKRKYLTVVDGIVGGEAEGPLSPTPVPSGVIVAGTDAIAVDLCAIRLMGLDWRKIPLYAKYNPAQRYRFSDFDGDVSKVNVVVQEGNTVNRQPLGELRAVKPFVPAPGWKDHIEL